MPEQNQKQLGNTLWAIPLEADGGNGGRRTLQEPRAGTQIGGGLCLFAARLSLFERRGGNGHHLAPRRAVPGRGGRAHPQKLLIAGHIDTVIGLPSNHFYSTGIPVCILMLKKCKKPNDVLFINAAEHFVKGKRQNQLTDEHIAKIIKTYKFREEASRYACRVEMAKIEKNDFDLNISRYISTAVGEVEISLEATHGELVEIEKAIAEANQKHNEFLKELGLARCHESPV